MAIAIGCQKEIIELAESIGIDPSICTGFRIEVSYDSVVTVTPTLCLDDKHLLKMKRVIEKAKADGFLIVNAPEAL